MHGPNILQYRGISPIPVQQCPQRDLDEFIQFPHWMCALQHEQRPQEIHFVLHGLPGFAVELGVWNATAGLFWYLARNALAPGRPLHTNLQVITLVSTRDIQRASRLADLVGPLLENPDW